MSILGEVLSKLNASEVDPDIRNLALAAIVGEEALDAAIEGDDSALDLAGASAESPPQPDRAYLSAIEVTSFRGVGPTARLELEPGPGLVVVAGRNGSGKSSFSDALEVLLTGDSWRWKDKSAQWKQGWRNLHGEDEPRVAAEFAVEGRRGNTVMWREWDESAKEASQGETLVQPYGEKRTDLEGFGWADAIDLYRPILSYSELGVIAENPASLFDALTGVLGLDEVVVAGERLRQRRLALEKTLKEAKKQLKDEIKPMLEESDDQRAEAVLEAVSTSRWDLDVVEAAASGSGDSDADTGSLRLLAALSAPDPEQVARLAEDLRTVGGELESLEASDAGRSHRLASILRLAVEEHRDHGDRDCPVCGEGRLDSDWLRQASEELKSLEAAAESYRTAVERLDQVMAEARRVLDFDYPDAETAVIDMGVLAEEVGMWSNAPDDPRGLANHLTTRLPPLAAAVESVASTVAEALKEREDAWRPVAIRLSAWIETARAGLEDDTRAKNLKVAEDAIAKVVEDLRSERFEPISAQAIELWRSLRLQSNVELNEVTLAGKGTRRRVDLQVTVDGEEGAALGVVSQGEVNCLALSLFFPRVMLEESPFRFIVIDDPIQAMDPARVDGLAKVFAEVAKQRQLVVFTHDDRLPEALRRLQLPHTLLHVVRRPGSVVELKSRLDPVAQYFLDAIAVEKDEDLPVGVASRVVPGFCRSGIEAACVEAVRRRRIKRGDPHSQVEETLAGRKTTELAALALFDDPDQGGKVLGEINRKWGNSAGDAFRDCQRGSHKGFSGSLRALVDESRKLAEGLRVQS